LPFRLSIVLHVFGLSVEWKPQFLHVHDKL
jgi:hypothetical protein